MAAPSLLFTKALETGRVEKVGAVFVSEPGGRGKLRAERKARTDDEASQAALGTIQAVADPVRPGHAPGR